MGDYLKADGGDLGQVASSALDLAEVDPRRALQLARDFRSWPQDNPTKMVAKGVAAWAVGRAQRHLGHYRQAAICLEVAVALLFEAGDASAGAKASVHLALAHIDAGQFDQAIELLGMADAHLTGVDKARVAAQRALAFQRGGRSTDALQDWGRALEMFEAAGMVVLAAACLESRGLVHAYRGELAQAESDISAARTTFSRQGEQIRAVEALHNLGFVAARGGDLPKALALFDQAQSQAAELGAVRPAALVDRVEVCLQAGLYAEARKLAAEVVRLLGQEGLGADVPEACLLAARACEQDGDFLAAMEWARQAARLFGEQNRPRWALLAHHAALSAEAAAGRLDLDLARRLEGVALDLRRAGWPHQAWQAELRLAEASVNVGDLQSAGTVLGRASKGWAKSMPLDRLRVKLCQARILLARDDAGGANRTLRAGLRWLRAYQSTLGSLELRAAGGGLSGTLMTLGIATARQLGRPGTALWWMEAVRADQEGPISPTANVSPEVTAALDGLRDVTGLQAQEGLDASRSLALRRRQAAWEEVVRRWSRHQSGPAGRQRPLEVAELARRLGTRLLVEYAIVEGVLVAVVLAGRDCRLVRLCPLEQFRGAVGQLRFAVNTTVRRPGSGVQAVEDEALRLQRLVLEPLDLPIMQEVVLVPEALGCTVPWAALPALANAAIVVAASASNLVRRQQPAANRAKRPEIVVVIGPDLYHGDEEAQAVAAAWGGRARILQGRSGSFASAASAIRGADVVHVVAHGSFNDANPLLSSVHLADGPVTGGELAQATSNAALVVLSCCDSGMVDRSGLGLSRLLYEAGARAVLGSVTPVLDEPSATFMAGAHRAIAQGTGPSAALVMARQKLRGASLLVPSLGFACFGDGFSGIVPGPA